MKRFEREQLLGYLIGALDEGEQAHLEARLREDDALAERLARLAEELRPLATLREEHEPPPGLADRTVAMVEDYRPTPAGGPAGSRSRAQPAQDMAPRLGTTASTSRAAGDVARGSHPARFGLSAPVDAARSWLSRFRAADVAVAAALLVAATVLLIPAIQSSRFNARLQTCQYNLQRIGAALMQYGQQHAGFLPYVPPEGRLANAGVYAPTLIEAELIEGPSSVVCPDSPLAERRERFQIPTLDELRRATPGQAVAMHRDLGGSYGYSLGYIDERGVYRGTRDLRREQFALVADRPDPANPEPRSLNHASQGQNVLFEDGRVAFLTTPASLTSRDHFFVNDQGAIGPGMHRDDSVVVSSTAEPLLPLERSR